MVNKSAESFLVHYVKKSFNKGIGVLIYFTYDNSGDWDQVKNIIHIEL